MPDIYSEMAAVVTELLTADADNFGQNISLVRPGAATPGAYPSAKPTYGPDTTYTLKAVADGVDDARLSNNIMAGRDGAQDDLIRIGDLEITAAPFDVAPEKTDYILVSGIHYKIVKIEAIPADRTNLVAWSIFARKR